MQPTLLPRLAVSTAWAIGALCGVAPAAALELELSSQRASLSAGFGSQTLHSLRLGWQGPSARALQLTLERKQAFGESATLWIGSFAQDLSADDRAGLALAHSDAPTIAAKWRVDAHYSRKLLPERNLVATLAGYAANVADGHRDRGLVGSAAWYFAERQVLELGLRAAQSNPGDNTAGRGFVAYTWGAVGADTLAIRLESGREAYQSLGANAAVADFRSHEAAVAWRHWLQPGAGLQLDWAHYTNPSYRRRTLGATAFVSF